VDDLSFNGGVFNSLLNSFLGDVLGVSLLVNLRNILGLVFNGVVVGVCLLSGDNFLSGDVLVFDDDSFDGNLFDSLDGLILSVRLLIGDVLNSTFSSDGLLLDLDWLLDDLDWLLDNLDWLLDVLDDWLLDVLDHWLLDNLYWLLVDWLLDVLDYWLRHNLYGL